MVKNFGELQQFAKFLPIFTISITFPMQIDFSSLTFFPPNFLQSLFAKLFCNQIFYYMVPMIIFLVQSHKYCKIMKAHVLMHYNHLSTAYTYHVPLDWSWAKYKIYCVDNYHILILIVLFDLFQSL